MTKSTLHRPVFAALCLLFAGGVFSAPAEAASPRTAYSYIYTAQIQTGSLNYQAFVAWADGDIGNYELGLAFDANNSMRAAFFEAYELTKGNGEGSWRSVEDNLDDAIFDLTLLLNAGPPREMARTGKSALSYALYARGLVEDIVD